MKINERLLIFVAAGFFSLFIRVMVTHVMRMLTIELMYLKQSDSYLQIKPLSMIFILFSNFTCKCEMSASIIP